MATRNSRREASHLTGSRRLAGTYWETLPERLTSFARVEIVQGDALDTMRRLRPEIADVIFLDPPFNLGKLYGRGGPNADRISDTKYLNYMSDLLVACITCLKPGGALFLYHIPRWAIVLASRLVEHLKFRHWIAISMKNGFARGRRLYPAHYALLYFTKGEPTCFSRPKIPPLKCRHCGGLVRDYGGYLDYVRAGVNLTDVWDDLSPVRHKAHKHRAANELNASIPQRVIAISGVENGLLVDPFAGSGTTIEAALKAGMSAIACDKEPLNCRLIAKRALTLTR